MSPRRPTYGYPPIIALLLATVLLTIMSLAYVRQQKQLVVSEKFLELKTIADLKSSQIIQWRRERLNEATSIYSNGMISHRVNDLIQGRDRGRVQRELSTWIRTLGASGNYREVTLFTPGGSVLVSVPERRRAPQPHVVTMVTDAARRQAIVFSDFHRDQDNGNVDINLAVPIIYQTGSGRECIAVLMLDVDPYTFLYPLIQSWPTPSESGETLLVRREGNTVLFLNDLRFRKDAALTFRVSLAATAMPAVRAALGQEGLFEGTDYRGVAVNSAICAIPGTPWAMVTKIDRAEIFAPVSRHLSHLAFNCAMLVVSLWLGGYLWWLRKKDAYLQVLYESELKYNDDLRLAETELQRAHEELEHKVARRTQELSESNESLRQQISRRVHLEHRLLEAQKMESIGQIAAGVAHEVRNPLNAILTITEALFREPGFEDNADFLPYRDHIRNQVTRLANLMNDLLELGREIPSSNLQQVGLQELTAETLDLWKGTGAWDDRVAVLDGDGRSMAAQVCADRLKLQQAVLNLLENAGNNSPPGSEIRLSLGIPEDGGSAGGMASIRVRDQGRGIADDKLSRIFEPFYSDRKGGTGLGLPLVKHYIEHMGGTVRIWNNDPPPGCTAEMLIPLVNEKQED